MRILFIIAFAFVVCAQASAQFHGWQRLQPTPPSEWGPRDVRALDSHTVIVTTADAVYRSDDAGDSWRQILHVAGTPDGVRFACVDRDTLYALRFFLHRSTDGGATWDTCTTPSFKTLHLAARRGLLVAVSSAGECAISTDGGNSWRMRTRAMPYPATVWSISFDRDDVLLAGGESGMYSSIDSGKTWINAGVHSFVTQVSHGASGMVAATGFDSIYIRNGRDAPWQAIKVQRRGSLTLSGIGIDRDDRLYVGSDSMVRVSTDRGDTWHDAYEGLDYTPVHFASGLDGNFYVVTMNGTMYRRSVTSSVSTYDAALAFRSHWDPDDRSLFIERSSDWSGDIELVLYDRLGRTIKDFGHVAYASGAKRIRVDVGDIAAGAYFLRVRNGSYWQSFMVLVSRPAA